MNHEYEVSREKIVRETYKVRAKSHEAAVEVAIGWYSLGIDPNKTDTRRVIGDWEATQILNPPRHKRSHKT